MGDNLIQRQKKAQNVYYEVGLTSGKQRFWDYFQLLLRDPRVMGKDTFGKKRLQKAYEILMEYDAFYSDAYTNSPEADYKQQKLDNELRKIGYEDFKPFRMRQPYINQRSIDKGPAKWRK